MYGDWSGFLDDNEEDTPVRWNPIPKPSTSNVIIPKFSHPSFQKRTKTGTILKRKPYFEDNEDSLFVNVPTELIEKMVSYLEYSDLHNCKTVNSRFCRIVENNLKNLDKPALEMFVVERIKRQSVVNGFLHQKATYRALLTANDLETFHIVAGKPNSHHWWNYQIRKAGDGDKLSDDVLPGMYRSEMVFDSLTKVLDVQSAPAVINKVATLTKHLDYFWRRFKILELCLINIKTEELQALINVKLDTACTIHRVTLRFETTDLTGDHVDMINTLRGHELCIDFTFGGTIEPRLWFSSVLRNAETMLIRNLGGIPNLTDNVFMSWTAPKLHICGQTSITVEGIKEFLMEWVAGTRDIIFICLQQEYTEVDWAKELEEFNPVDEGKENGRTITANDGRKVNITWEELSLKLIKPNCSIKDLDPVFHYVGGKRL